MEKKKLWELRDTTSDWNRAVVVLKQESFNRQYSEEARSYEISSDAKYFDGNMNGSSLFGHCLDGTDNGVRLDLYMERENGWVAEYCYIID